MTLSGTITAEDGALGIQHCTQACALARSVERALLFAFPQYRVWGVIRTLVVIDLMDGDDSQAELRLTSELQQFIRDFDAGRPCVYPVPWTLRLHNRNDDVPIPVPAEVCGLR